MAVCGFDNGVLRRYEACLNRLCRACVLIFLVWCVLSETLGLVCEIYCGLCLGFVLLFVVVELLFNTVFDGCDSGTRHVGLGKVVRFDNGDVENPGFRGA